MSLDAPDTWFLPAMATIVTIVAVGGVGWVRRRRPPFDLNAALHLFAYTGTHDFSDPANVTELARMLRIACRTGDLALTSALLELGVPVDGPPGGGVTPLIHAAEYGHLKCVKRLLQANAEIDKTDISGVTAAAAAASHGRLPVVVALIQAGADPNPVLLLGCKNLPSHNTMFVQPNVAQVALAHGADISSSLDSKGRNPLFWASYVGNTRTLQLLLSTLAAKGQGELVDARCELGMTALMIAAHRGHLPAVRLLLDHKADPRLRNSFHCTALHYACDNHYLAQKSELLHRQVVGALIEAGADLDVATQHPTVSPPPGSTPLMCALQRGFSSVAAQLVAAGACVNTPSVAGCTPLMQAAGRGQPTLTGLLLRSGADAGVASSPLDALSASLGCLNAALSASLIGMSPLRPGNSVKARLEDSVAAVTAGLAPDGGGWGSEEGLGNYAGSPVGMWRFERADMGPAAFDEASLGVARRCLECARLLIRAGADTRPLYSGVRGKPVLEILEPPSREYRRLPLARQLLSHAQLEELWGGVRAAVDRRLRVWLSERRCQALMCLRAAGNDPPSDVLELICMKAGLVP